MSKLYLYGDKIYQWNPNGLQAASLRVKNLHEFIGCSRVHLYNYFNHRNVPKDDKVPALLKYAPESLICIATVKGDRAVKEPVVQKPSLPVNSPEAVKLYRSIGRKQIESPTGWVRFSGTYGPAGVTADDAKKIIRKLEKAGLVETRITESKKGPKPLEIRFTEDPQWLLQ